MRPIAVLLAPVVLAGTAACGDAAPAPTPAPASAAAASVPGGARAELAARAALAQDRRFAALYTWTVPDREPRNVVATVAVDGSWRVDVASGALGGSSDVAVVDNPAGVFTCALSSVANPVTPTCVRVADPGRRIPARVDPQVQRVFRQWLGVFTDREAPLSVSAAVPLPGSSGRCFSIDSISASLAAAVDVGIYCYADDGLLTAARVGYGTLTLAGEPVAPPASVDLPGPVVEGEPLGMDAAPAPPPSVDPTIR